MSGGWVPFPHPSPLPEGEGAVLSGDKVWCSSCDIRKKPYYPATPNSPLSLWERARVRVRADHLHHRPRPAIGFKPPCPQS